MADSLTEEQMRQFRFRPSIDGERGPMTRLMCEECVEFVAEWDYRETFNLENATTMAMEHIDVCAMKLRVRDYGDDE